MNALPQHFELSCRSCKWREQLGFAEVLERLRVGGMLRRITEPDREITIELARTTAKSWSCPSCQKVGLTFRIVQDDPGTWGDARVCEACNQVIPPERVELFPNSTLCARCQRAVESGKSPVDEYCERCGSVLQLKATKSAGISRYTMYCPACRR